MESFDALLDELEVLIGEVDGLDDPTRERVLRLLDGVDAVHRMALVRLASHLGDEALTELRDADPVVAWLLDAYRIGVDERQEAAEALEATRPYVDAQGGRVELLDVREGVVRVRLSVGASAGCGSAETLRDAIAEGLRERWPGFVALEVEEAAPARGAQQGAPIPEIRRRRR